MIRRVTVLVAALALLACQAPTANSPTKKSSTSRKIAATSKPATAPDATAMPGAKPTPTPTATPTASATAEPADSTPTAAPAVGLVAGAQAADTWATGPSLRRGRFGHVAAMLGDQLAVFEGESRPSLELLAPGALTWNLVTSYDIARADIAENALVGGRMLMTLGTGAKPVIAGGQGGGSVEPAIYSYGAEGPSEQLGTLAFPAVAAAGGLSEGQLVIAGGLSTPETVESAVQIFHMGIRSVTQGASMPTGVAGAASVVVGHKLYVFGGYTFEGGQAVATNKVQVYDLEGNSWRASGDGAADPPAALAEARHSAAAVVVDGQILVAGGVRANGQVTGEALLYDPAARTWKTLAPLPTPRALLALVATGGRVWALGGAGASRQPLTTVEVYRP